MISLDLTSSRGYSRDTILLDVVHSACLKLAPISRHPRTMIVTVWNGCSVCILVHTSQAVKTELWAPVRSRSLSTDQSCARNSPEMPETDVLEHRFEHAPRTTPNKMATCEYPLYIPSVASVKRNTQIHVRKGMNTFCIFVSCSKAAQSSPDLSGCMKCDLDTRLLPCLDTRHNLIWSINSSNSIQSDHFKA